MLYPPQNSLQSPIYPFLDRNCRIKFQAMQNNCIYHFIYTYKEIGHTRAEAAHVMTSLEDLNQVCHKQLSKFYTNLKEFHIPWHNTLVEWHKPPTRDKTINDITPMDWVQNPVARPLYSKFS